MDEPSTVAGRFFNDNGLSLALFTLFVVCLAGQAATGFHAFNGSQTSAHLAPISFQAYLGTGNFLDGIFSNWQAAVLQLAVLISFGAVLRQKGATHSRQPGDDSDPGRGDHGWLYAHSLSLAFAGLFVATFVAHLIFGAMKYDEDLPCSNCQRLLWEPTPPRPPSGSRHYSVGRQNSWRLACMSSSASSSVRRRHPNRSQSMRATTKPGGQTNSRHG